MKLNYKYLKKQNIELKEQMNNDNTPLIKMYKTTLKN